MGKIFIVAAKRTAVGKFGGGLSSLSAADIAAVVIKDILQSINIDPAKIDEVIVGNVLMAGQKQGIARQASIKAGIP
ncbi:MAG: acetyl-CoA C-acyltransferase, partial [Bacteroidales bacterium]|nr:acetyl-CoA C-acyltransferase [Bacteroidales bacterium]